MNVQIVTVNLVPNISTPDVVRVSQYDVGRPLMFRVLDGVESAYSIAYATSVTIVGTKPSGLGFSATGTIVNNTVTLNTTLDMTQEAGRIPTEVRFARTGEDIGTANFILDVEPSPHPEGTTDGTQETMQNLETRLQGQIDALDSRIDAIEGDQSIIDDIDALDARVTALEQGGSGLTQAEKQLILTLFSKAAYAENDAGSAYDALESMWTTATRSVSYSLTHVTSSNTSASVESGQSYTTTLTADSNYTLNSVSVTMGGVDITSTAYSSGTITIPSVTGNIVITATAVLAAQSITATYTQSGTVYDTDSLDSLKADLVVTANYSGGTSETIPSSNYTLSGTLTVGTSTITVTYAGLTDTFSVAVTKAPTIPIWHQSLTVYDGTFGTDTQLQSELAQNGTWTLGLELDEIDSSQVTNARIFYAGDTFNFYIQGGANFRLGDGVTTNTDITQMSLVDLTQPFRLVICNDNGTQTAYWSYYNKSGTQVTGSVSKQFSPSRTLLIGAYALSGSLTQRFKATYNDVSIYDVALSNEEINSYLTGA